MTDTTERTLPDLPAGWRILKLMQRVNSAKNLRTNGGGQWRCNLHPGIDHNGDYMPSVSADGDTPRSAVLNAIAKIAELETRPTQAVLDGAELLRSLRRSKPLDTI